MSTFGGAGIMLGSWGENDWVLSGNARWFALACVLLVVVVALYYVFTYILDALNKDKKQGMDGRLPGEVLSRNLSWTGGEPSQIGQGGVMADPNYGAARDDAILAMSRGDAVKQGLMAGRGYDMPSFWSADSVNRESQQQRFNMKDGELLGFRVNKPVQGAASGSAEAPLSDAKLQGTLLGQSQLQY